VFRRALAAVLLARCDPLGVPSKRVGRSFVISRALVAVTCERVVCRHFSVAPRRLSQGANGQGPRDSRAGVLKMAPVFICTSTPRNLPQLQIRTYKTVSVRVFGIRLCCNLLQTHRVCCYIENRLFNLRFTSFVIHFVGSMEGTGSSRLCRVISVT
jgi:hypothetical protein